MPLQVETPADEQLAGLEAVKLWLRIDHDADDALLESLIRAAHRQIEGRTSRALTLTEYKLIRRDFGCEADGLLVLPRPPLVTVDSVEVYDGGELVELTVDVDYRVIPSGDRGIGGIEPVNAWPSLDDRADAVQVTYTAGYAVEQIPDDLVVALQLALAAWYDDRRAGSLPEASAELIELWRVYDHRVAEVLR